MSYFFNIHVNILFTPQTKDIQKENVSLLLLKDKAIRFIQYFHILGQIWTKVEFAVVHFSKSTETTLFKKNTAVIYLKRQPGRLLEAVKEKLIMENKVTYSEL